MTYVLDASALIAYVRGEAGGEVILAALEDTENVCVAHAINLCEVYYGFHRVLGEAEADEVLSAIEAAG